jgi:hypothetical protein
MRPSPDNLLGVVMLQKVKGHKSKMVYSREASRSLIKYFKKIELGGSFTNPHHKCIFELAKQLTGPQLRKSNPKLVHDLQFLPDDKLAYLKVEFANGSTIDIDPISRTCQELRDELFWLAEGIELDLDLSGNNPIGGDDDEEGEGKSAKKK